MGAMTLAPRPKAGRSQAEEATRRQRVGRSRARLGGFLANFQPQQSRYMLHAAHDSSWPLTRPPSEFLEAPLPNCPDFRRRWPLAPLTKQFSFFFVRGGASWFP